MMDSMSRQRMGTMFSKVPEPSRSNMSLAFCVFVECFRSEVVTPMRPCHTPSMWMDRVHMNSSQVSIVVNRNSYATCWSHAEHQEQSEFPPGLHITLCRVLQNWATSMFSAALFARLKNILTPQHGHVLYTGFTNPLAPQQRYPSSPLHKHLQISVPVESSLEKRKHDHIHELSAHSQVNVQHGSVSCPGLKQHLITCLPQGELTCETVSFVNTCAAVTKRQSTTS